MADQFSREELQKITELLNRQATLQQEINSGLKGYTEALEKIKSLTETIEYNKKLIAKLDKEALNATGDDLKLIEKKLEILKKQQDYLEDENKLLKDNVKEANKFNIISAATLAGMVKGIKAVPNALKGMRGNINSWGLLEMDKAIRMSVLEMGLLGDNANNYRNTIEETAMSTIDIGVGIEQLTQLQSVYSQELGRTVMLSQQGLEAMGDMSIATGLGAEGAAQMAAEMENQGISAERTADYMKDSMNSSSKLGLNASKVIKNIAKGIGLLNRYNFKDGYKGLERMAKTVTRLGVEMDFISGMADKMFDIEGAVDMAAQLQVLGGAWSNLADPFKLAYMARNDMAALTEEIGKAAGASAVWDEKTKDFKIGAMEMDKLRIIAQQTGVAVEELVTAAKNFKKFEKVGGQLRINVDDDTKEFIQNSAKLNEKGQASIMIKGEPKLVNALNNSDKKYLEAQQKESLKLKERAEASLTFDEKITNIINMFKTAMLQALEGIDDVIKPLLESFKSPEFKKDLIELGKDIKEFIIGLKGVVTVMTKVVNFLGPSGIIAMMLVPSIISLTSSLLNFGKIIPKLFGGGGGAAGAGLGARALGAGGFGLAGLGVGALTDYASNKAKESGNEKTGKTIGVLGKSAEYALYGAAIGTLVPIIGNAVGAAIGGGIGLAKGLYDMNEPANDGIFSSPIHDGYSSGDFSKNRGLIQNGKVTPIDNKDDLLAYKPNGPVDKSIKSSSSKMKVSFDDINISGEIQLVLPGNQTINVDLANNPGFINAITTKINLELEKRVKGMNIG